MYPYTTPEIISDVLWQGQKGSKNFVSLLRCPKLPFGLERRAILTAAPFRFTLIRHRRRSSSKHDTLRVPSGSCLCCFFNKEKDTAFAMSFGRGRRARTLGTRFWRPLLYQLSYTPILIKWWAIRDSNPGPTGYEPVALTN